MVRYINVKCWGNSNGAIYPTGEIISISCLHQNLGNISLSIKAVDVPVASATEPFTGSPPSSPVPAYTTDFGSGQVRIPGDKLNGPDANISPFASTDPNNKACYRIKDINTNYMYYADVADYDSKVGPSCNPITTVPAGCFAPTSVHTTSINPTNIKFDFTEPGGTVVGFEWFNSTVDATPVPPPDGNFIPAGHSGVIAVTGLTTATHYYLFIRTICGIGTYSSFVRLAYLTS